MKWDFIQAILQLKICRGYNSCGTSSWTPTVYIHHSRMKFMCLWDAVWYQCLVYTTQVNSAIRAIWLAPKSRDIKHYSPPGGFWVEKRKSRETHFIRKESHSLGIAIVLYILKQLFASVSVNWLAVDIYLAVNMHRYSPILRRMIVKYIIG